MAMIHLDFNDSLVIEDAKEMDVEVEYMYESFDEGIDIGDVATLSPSELPSRKRKRSQPLSWEQKTQMKKLRNRIAAQTSRDRKKARMDYLEDTVKDLKLQNDKCLKEIEELKKKNELLADKKQELTKVLSERRHTCSCGKTKSTTEHSRNLSHNSVADDLSLRPAESYDPQQKGLGPSPAEVVTESQSVVLWKILVLFLLSQKYFQTSQRTNSSNWLQACSLTWGNPEQTEWAQWKERCEPLAKKNADTLLRWWGKHQRSWNPVDVPT